MIHWDVSPEILRLGPLALRWYGVCFALAFLLGFFIVQGIYRRELKPERDLDRLLFYMLGGTLVGRNAYSKRFHVGDPDLRSPSGRHRVSGGGCNPGQPGGR